MELSNCPEAHRLDISTRMIQQRHEPRCVQMLPSCYTGISSAQQKCKHFASSNIKKKPQAWKAALPDSSVNTAFTLRVSTETSAAEEMNQEIWIKWNKH